MKKLIIAFFLYISVVSTAFAPVYATLSIPTATAIHWVDPSYYKPLINALFLYESSCNPNACNEQSGATGGLQITWILLDEYNTLTNHNYILEDMKDFELSKEIFMYYTIHDHFGNVVAPKSYGQMSREWWGQDSFTETYWEEVKVLIK